VVTLKSTMLGKKPRQRSTSLTDRERETERGGREREREIESEAVIVEQMAAHKLLVKLKMLAKTDVGKLSAITTECQKKCSN